MIYEAPTVSDYGSIADHTFGNNGGNEKGGGVVQHYDWKCEWSSGPGENNCGNHPNF
ncbi:MAG: hypothetical protein ACRDI3_01055 [Actinomycetota bacterium]